MSVGWVRRDAILLSRRAAVRTWSAMGPAEADRRRRRPTRAAVLMSADDYESLMETLDLLSDAEAMAAIRRGDADLAAGHSHDLDDVMTEMRASGRLPA